MANSQSKFYGFLALILVAGAALIGFVVISNRGGASVGEVDPVVLQNLIDSGPSDQLAVISGADDAPVSVEEFADYLCGACGMVATLSVPQILENYVDTGKARFVFYDYVLNPASHAKTAAQAARCAGDQNAFWAMHKVLMSRQREWGTARNPLRVIREYADGLGLDGAAVETCVENGTYLDVVMASTQHAKQRGLNSTPVFFFNGRPFAGARGYDQMAQIIEEELARGQNQ
ncbi:MAG: thioredoxin domain-containing protein [Gemmatimonadetes bacterium]|nr:thioredoxin domain-containing protein [Gemmatimonadota bacterium]NIO31272.1 thioredoxin domain-containing protein [Gemmatimonadota bacterium]